MTGELNIATVLIYSVAYVVAAVVGHFFVSRLLRRYRLKEDGGLEKAGAIIGVLERVFTITLVLMGEYTALVLVFTVKSLSRFEQLKEREFAEYYLIGTLSSVQFAMLVGIFALWLQRCYSNSTW